MALDSTVKSLLDSFADTQGALRIPTQPLESSNPRIGTAIDAAIAAAQASGGQLYTPAVGANWVDPDPTTVKQALDRLAAAVATLQSGPIA